MLYQAKLRPGRTGRGRRFLPAVNVILGMNQIDSGGFSTLSNLLDSPSLYPYTSRFTLLTHGYNFA